MGKATKKTAIILMMIILSSKVTGFLRDILLGRTFGVGNTTDAYLTALNIPVILFSGISASLGTTFIPMFFDIKEKKGINHVHKFTSNLINIVIIISIIFIVVGMVFTPYIVKIFAIGFKGSVLDLTISYSRILMFSMIFIAINGLMTSFLIASGNLYISGLITIPFNIFVLISIFLGSITNSYVMVYGTLLAYIAQFLFQLPSIFKYGYKHEFKVNFKDDDIVKILVLVLPVFIGSYVNQINTVVNRTLASKLASGSITALDYSNKLNMFAVGIIVISLSTIMYPIFSRLANEKKIQEFKHNVSKSVNITLITMVPIMVIMLGLSTPIVRVLFQEGAFDERATQLTSTALFYYSIGIVAYGLREILSKAFYSLQDTKTPMKNATVAVFINVILSVVLVRKLGIGGLALASSISAIITAILLFISLRRKIGKIGMKHIIITFLKVIIASIFMAIFMKYIYIEVVKIGSVFIDGERELIALASLISSLIGLNIYLIITLILNVKESKEIVYSFKGKLRQIIYKR